MTTQSRPLHRDSARLTNVPVEQSLAVQPTRKDAASLASAFVDRVLPINVLGSWAGYLIGAACARWCTRQMVTGAGRHYN
ncbi:hypothetical protein [Variovorax paradoxus]|uniref:hypothetical protein n=1 Tax=Variovorax paradoxus TaxID=34073 RepID=UPI000ADF276C|nr:hypothetical protein [Variovorax paradoxus]